MAWAAVIGAGASLLGSSMSSGAAGNASSTQAASSDAATAETKRQYDQNRQDQLPWLQRGNAAGDKLNFLMGLSPGGAYGPNGSGAPTRDQLRSELLGQYTSQSQTGGYPSAGIGLMDGVSIPDGDFDGYSIRNNQIFYGPTNSTKSTVDEAGLNAEIDRRMAAQAAEQAQAQSSAQNDPAFGSLTRDFSLADFYKDPGYDFRMSEGEKGINRSAAARGGYYSGATEKALQRFAQNTASDEFQNAFNRDNLNKTNKYNRLAGISGTGQTTATSLGAQGLQSAALQGQSMQNAGEARAAGYIGQSSAFNGGLSNLNKLYQQRNTPTSYDYSGYTPPTSGPIGSYADNPFQANYI